MKKIILCTAVALLPLFANAANTNSWQGWKQIRNDNTGKCLASLKPPLSSYFQPIYINCDAQYQDQHWSFQNGVFTNRNDGRKLSDTAEANTTGFLKSGDSSSSYVTDEVGRIYRTIGGYAEVIAPYIEHYGSWYPRVGSYGFTDQAKYPHTFLTVTNFVTSQGINIPNFDPSKQRVNGMNAVMSGGWIGGTYNASIDNFGYGGRFNAYVVAGSYAKVVELQVEGNKIKALGAKYRNGGYDRNANDYITANVATSESDNGYGVNNPNFTFGTPSLDVKAWLPTENDLSSRLNVAPFLQNVFGFYTTASLTTTDGYWLSALNFPKNTSAIPTNSTVLFRSNSSYSVSFENRFTLEQATDYEIIYNGNNWDLRKIFGNTFINSYGLNLPESEALAVKTVTAVIAGGWVQGQPSAEIDSFGNGLYNAYVHSSGGIVKVVGFTIENGKIKITGAKYRTGDYVRDASDYITAPIASSANASGYGLTYVAARLQGK